MGPERKKKPEIFLIKLYHCFVFPIYEVLFRLNFLFIIWLFLSKLICFAALVKIAAKQGFNEQGKKKAKWL